MHLAEDYSIACGSVNTSKRSIIKQEEECNLSCQISRPFRQKLQNNDTMFKNIIMPLGNINTENTLIQLSVIDAVPPLMLIAVQLLE